MAPAEPKPRIFRYIRCRNCGSYLTLQDSTGGGFCSKVCQARFSRCHVCGCYFESSDEHDVCSEICGREYKLSRKYG